MVELKIYTDEGCTIELTGEMQVGPEIGMDGTNGETNINPIWIKNTGTAPILDTVLTETLDVGWGCSYSLDGVIYDDATLVLGDVDVGDIIKVYVKVAVLPLTAPATNVTVKFTISGTHIEI